MAEKTLNVLPAISGPRNTLISDIGRDVMMAMGCRKEQYSEGMTAVALIARLRTLAA
jgi:hypothetical protein